MSNSDGTGSVGQGLKRIAIGLVFVAAIVWAGSSIRNNWLVIPVTTACTTLAAFLIGSHLDKKSKVKAVITFGGLGLLAGFLWWVTA